MVRATQRAALAAVPPRIEEATRGTSEYLDRKLLRRLLSDPFGMIGKSRAYQRGERCVSSV